MNQPFLVEPKGPCGLSAVVFSVGFRNPMDALARVESDLRERNVRGTVLFDLLLSNGTKYNRFIVGEFDGEHFAARFDRADSRHDDFASFCASVYQKSVDVLDPSLLSPAMRFALKRGVPL